MIFGILSFLCVIIGWIIIGFNMFFKKKSLDIIASIIFILGLLIILFFYLINLHNTFDYLYKLFERWFCSL